MDVFLVPVSASAYELYCEDADPPDQPVDTQPAQGLFRRAQFRFAQMLAEAERDRRRGAAVRPETGWFDRMKRRTMRWVAESIAEQRLLWSLRRETAATFHYPDDMAEDAAEQVRRQHLARDFDKHRFWLAIDSLLMVAAGLLFWLPGPNFLGYYFAFRVFGHYLSVRGARNGLSGLQWTNRGSAPLTELRGALSLEPSVRLRQVEDVASRLRLDHLATFFQRTVPS